MTALAGSSTRTGAALVGQQMERLSQVVRPGSHSNSGRGPTLCTGIQENRIFRGSILNMIF